MVKVFINDFAENCYVLSYKTDAYIIDPGSNVEAVKAYVDSEQLSIRAVLLTHGHYDHICGLNSLLETLNAPVYIHPLERDFLFDPSLNLSVYMDGYFKLKHKSKLQVFDEQNVFKLGDETLQIYHTPGHTRGGVCFHYRNMLFSGDTLFKESIGRTDLPTGDASTLIASIKSLYLKLSDNTIIYPGHGHFSTIVHEKTNNPYVKTA